MIDLQVPDYMSVNVFDARGKGCNRCKYFSKGYCVYNPPELNGFPNIDKISSVVSGYNASNLYKYEFTKCSRFVFCESRESKVLDTFISTNTSHILSKHSIVKIKDIINIEYPVFKLNGVGAKTISDLGLFLKGKGFDLRFYYKITNV